MVVMAVGSSAALVHPPAGHPSRCDAAAVEAGEPTVGGDDTPGVTRLALTFVDRTRPTAPDGTRADEHLGCRILETSVRIPTAATGPKPLVLALHGRDGDPTSLRPLLDAWVTAGYVVAAPFFLVTAKDHHGNPTSSASARQAADTRFVLDQLLRLDADPASTLHGAIDPRHVGAAGMSLGGMTVYGLISNTCCRDDRITVAELLAAVYRPFPNGRYQEQQVPVLLVQGDQDEGYHNSMEAYPRLGAPKWFVTLHGSTHSPPFELPRGPEAQLVDTTTTAFWNRYLLGDVTSAQRLVTAIARSNGAASLRHTDASNGGRASG
jgi:dienelactone hydrolase